jgi:hypothetical protein
MRRSWRASVSMAPTNPLARKHKALIERGLILPELLED